MTAMASPPEIKAALREWIRARHPDQEGADLDERTPLIKARYLTSPEVPDLLLFIEELRRSAIDPAALSPGVFQSIDSIYDAFFEKA